MLENVVNRYNNTVHRTIDVTSDSYAEYIKLFNEKDLQFNVGDRVRIWKYKNIFAKEYT